MHITSRFWWSILWTCLFIWPTLTYCWILSRRPAVPLSGGSALIQTSCRSAKLSDWILFSTWSHVSMVGHLSHLARWTPFFSGPIASLWSVPPLFQYSTRSNTPFNFMWCMFCPELWAHLSGPPGRFLFLIMRCRWVWSRCSVLNRWVSWTNTSFPVTNRIR